MFRCEIRPMLKALLLHVRVGRLSPGFFEVLLVLVLCLRRRFVCLSYEEELFSRIRSALNVEFQYNSRYNFVEISAFDVKYLFPQKDEPLRRSSFDYLVLGFFYMEQPVEHIKESLGDKQWDVLQKIWQVVAEDYELRKKRDAFLDFLELERREGLRAIAEWRHYLKQKSSVNSKNEDS